MGHVNRPLISWFLANKIVFDMAFIRVSLVFTSVPLVLPRTPLVFTHVP